jgi:hypothetical protein
MKIARTFLSLSPPTSKTHLCCANCWTAGISFFFGRIEGEFALYNITSFTGQNGVEIRQFRAGWAGIPPWWKFISYKVELGYTKGSVRPGDVYIQHDFSNGSAVVLGNQGSSQSLNASTGSLSRLFMESPLPVSAFGLDNRLGASFDFHKHRGGGPRDCIHQERDQQRFETRDSSARLLQPGSIK